MSKLSDARESYNKAKLRHQLVELRTDRDATVLSIAKVSVGSVITAGQQFITLIASDAPLEVEVNIQGSDDGYVNLGNSVAIKFDTFPYMHFGMAHGTVRIISADSFSTADEQRNPTGATALPSSAPGNAVWYRSRISLDKVELRDLPPDFKLMPGMPVTADIKIGERTALGFFFERLVPVATEGMREP